MNNEVYHDTKTIPLAERETFNNTIILLTLVKSQYYYIVGFSRPSNIIEIAFDFESNLHSIITETITLHFAESKDDIILRCKIRNIAKEMQLENGIFFNGKGKVEKYEDGVQYECHISKDRLIPLSIEKMNLFILDAKKEIINFIEGQFFKYLCKN